MLEVICRRFLRGLAALLLVSFLLFLLTCLMPGNYFDLGAAGKEISPQTLAQLRAQFHMDQPPLSRYFFWLRDVVRLDFGTSLIYKQPVSGLIAAFLPTTLLVAGTAFCLELLLGLTLTIAAGCRARRRALHLSPLWLISMCLPSFLFCIGLQWLFGTKLGLLPLGGLASSASASLADRVWHLILPCAALAIPEGIRLSNYLLARLEPILREDYIRLERATGKRRLRAVCTVALPNALTPLATYLGMSLPYLFSGSVVVEALFSIPGLGLLGYQAVLQRDYPLLMACTLLMAAATVAGRILSDMLYPLCDPRIHAPRFGRKAA